MNLFLVFSNDFRKKKKKRKSYELQPAGQDWLHCIKGASGVIEVKFISSCKKRC